MGFEKPIAYVVSYWLYTDRGMRNVERVQSYSSSGSGFCVVHLFRRRAMLTGWNACCIQRIGRWR